MQEIVLYRTGTQITSISRLINVSQLKHLGTNLSYLKQQNCAFSETTEKASLKYQKLKKREKRAGKKSMKLKQT